MNSMIEAFLAIDSGLMTMDSTRIGVFRTFESTKRFASAQNLTFLSVSQELFLSSLPFLLSFLPLSCCLDGIHSFSIHSFLKLSLTGLVTIFRNQQLHIHIHSN